MKIKTTILMGDNQEFTDDIGRVHGAVTSLYAQLSTDLESNITEGNLAHTKLVGMFLNKYLDASTMHEQFAHSAHIEGKYDEASTHLKNVNDTIASVHQVLHYNFGGDNTITKNFMNNKYRVSNQITEYGENNA